MDDELKEQLSPEVREKLILYLEGHLDLDRWQFRLTHVAPNAGRSVIYDSPKCRVMFYLDIDVREGDRILSWYARSHVPNEVDLLMEWQGEQCFAWHNIRRPPFWQFLEGLTVEDAAEQDRVGERWPAYAAFEATEYGRTLRGTEWTLALEGFVWKHYGDRLFSLFDKRQPERWEEFRQYIREYYRLNPHKPLQGDTSPPRYQIC